MKKKFAKIKKGLGKYEREKGDVPEQKGVIYIKNGG